MTGVPPGDESTSGRAGCVSTTDGVPEELRSIEENEIDAAHRDNLLFSENRAQAAWTFLAYAEGTVFEATLSGSPSIRMAPDVVVNLAKWPMRWIWDLCPPEGVVDQTRTSLRSPAVRDLYDLAYRYFQYETVFSQASRGHWRIHSEANRIIVTARDESSVRWDAYDRVVDAIEQSDLPSECRPPDAEEVSALYPAVRIEGRRFRYEVDDDLLDRARRVLSPLLDLRFRLPPDWRLGRYTLGEYRGVLQTLSVMSNLHLLARHQAIQQGVPDLGSADALLVLDRRHLIKRLAHGAGLSGAVVWEIVRELTFGGQDMKQPDIALQPLVPLTGHRYCWAPSFVSSSALERNLITLLNRFPASQRAYERLSGQREGFLRDKLESAFKKIGVRCWSDAVPGWGRGRDVDLVAIDDRSKQCLVMELKSFLGPADPPELHHRSEELAKGIRQIRVRRCLATEQRAALDRTLGIDRHFSLTFLVVSETWAGGGLVIDEEVPILRSSTLIRKIRETRDLTAVASWVSNRDFLPVDGVHYREVRDNVRIGNRVLEWYRIGVGAEYMNQSSGSGSSGSQERKLR